MSQAVLPVSSKSSISKPSCGATPPTFQVVTKILKKQNEEKEGEQKKTRKDEHKPYNDTNKLIIC